MKKQLLLAISVAFSLGIFSKGAFAQSEQDAARKREYLRSQLMETYQNLVTMSDKEWRSTMLDGASRMEKEGKKENARVVLKLADPSMRNFALDLFKNKIDEVSQNGLIWMAGPWYCWGFGCFWLTLMTIMTLDGSEVENF